VKAAENGAYDGVDEAGLFLRVVPTKGLAEIGLRQ